MMGMLSEWWKNYNSPEKVEERHRRKLRRMEMQAEYLEKRVKIEEAQAKIVKVQAGKPIQEQKTYPGLIK